MGSSTATYRTPSSRAEFPGIGRQTKIAALFALLMLVLTFAYEPFAAPAGFIFCGAVRRDSELRLKQRQSVHIHDHIRPGNLLAVGKSQHLSHTVLSFSGQTPSK